MAEHVYQFGDPVWVKWDNREWKGHYIRLDNTGRHLVCHADNEDGDWNCVGNDEVRPRIVAPARGWRLPEPGDVVRVLTGPHAGEYDVISVWWDKDKPLLCRSGAKPSQRFDLHEVDVLRLHDDPSPPPAPVEPKLETPEPKSDLVKALWWLSIASDLQDEVISLGDQIMAKAVKKAIDKAAQKLGADQ